MLLYPVFSCRWQNARSETLHWFWLAFAVIELQAWIIFSKYTSLNILFQRGCFCWAYKWHYKLKFTLQLGMGRMHHELSHRLWGPQNRRTSPSPLLSLTFLWIARWALPVHMTCLELYGFSSPYCPSINNRYPVRLLNDLRFYAEHSSAFPIK